VSLPQLQLKPERRLIEQCPAKEIDLPSNQAALYLACRLHFAHFA
jgi:hypothetical protein